MTFVRIANSRNKVLFSPRCCNEWKCWDSKIMKKKNQELGRHFVQQVTYLKIIGTNNFQKMF